MNFRNRREGIFVICNILIPLVIGAYIYVCWDSDSYFGNWIRSFLVVPEVGMDTDFMKFMRNWGCDFLWAYALFFSLYSSTKNVIASIRNSVTCSILVESLQLIQIDYVKCGTFDILDILIEVIAVCIGAAFLGWHHHINDKERRN